MQRNDDWVAAVLLVCVPVVVACVLIYQWLSAIASVLGVDLPTAVWFSLYAAVGVIATCVLWFRYGLAGGVRRWWPALAAVFWLASCQLLNYWGVQHDGSWSLLDDTRKTSGPVEWYAQTGLQLVVGALLLLGFAIDSEARPFS